MPSGSLPVAQIAGWKRRSSPPSAWNFGSRRATNYSTDDDTLTAGIQNKLTIDNIPHDPADETIDCFVLDVGTDGKFREPALISSAYSVTLTGGISASVTTIGVSALASASDFLDDDFIEIDDGANREYCLIQSGGGTQTWTVVRGIHGTSGTVFASGATVRRVAFNVPHSSVVLDGDSTALAAPVIAIDPILNGFRLTFTPPTDTNGILQNYYLYRGVASPAAALRKVLPGGSTEVEVFLNSSDDKAATYYFRAKSYTRWKVLSTSFSNEVSGRVLTQGDETPAVQPDPPTLAAVANGGGAQGFFFTVGVVFSSATGTGGVTKTQLQAALASATHGVSTGFSATVYDQEIPRPPTNTVVRVDNASAAVGGAYQFSARVYNVDAAAWSDWSSPITAATAVGAVDSNPAAPPSGFYVAAASGAEGGVGNALVANILQPGGADTNTIYAFRIQGSETLWSANLADTLLLTAISASGTGDATVGGQTMTNLSVSLGAANYAGYILFCYDSANTTTGEIVHPFSTNIVSNTASTITIEAYFPKTSVGLNWAIGPAWNTYDYDAPGFTLGPLRGGIDHLGTGRAGDIYQFSPFPFSKAAYWRVRSENQIGWSQFKYHDGTAAGTTTRASATQFTPSKLQGSAVGDNAIAAPQQSNDTAPLVHDLDFIPYVGAEYNRVSWSAGFLYFQDGTSQAINAGSTSALTAGLPYWIYALVGASASATLQVTSTVSSTVGTDKVILAVAVATSDTNETVSIVDVASGADTILTAAIANFGKLSAISADLGSITAGTVTGATIQTAASGARVVMTSSTWTVYDATHRRIEVSTSGDYINFYALGGAQVASVGGGSDSFKFDIIKAGSATNLLLGKSGSAWTEIECWGAVKMKVAALEITEGGTGSTTASAARTALGLAIGTDVQAFDADLSGLAGLSSNGIVCRTGAGTYSPRTVTNADGNLAIGNPGGVLGNIAINFQSAISINSLVVGSPTGGDKGGGTINAESVYDDSVLLADFVFEPGYKLMAIPEMAAFFRENYRLPTIDGRERWKSSRPALGEIVNQIWETVECHARYIAELDERMKK